MKKYLILFFIFFVILVFYGVSPVTTMNHYASGIDSNGLLIADDDTDAPTPVPNNTTPIKNREDPFAVFGQNDE
jgi:hypothetical protein